MDSSYSRRLAATAEVKLQLPYIDSPTRPLYTTITPLNFPLTGHLIKLNLDQGELWEEAVSGRVVCPEGPITQ